MALGAPRAPPSGCSRARPQVHSVFRVKTLTHQLSMTRKRQRIADGLVLVTGEQANEFEAEPRRDVATYVSLHHTLMLAYARAGATARGASRCLVFQRARRVQASSSWIRSQRNRRQWIATARITSRRERGASRAATGGPSRVRCLWMSCSPTTGGLHSVPPSFPRIRPSSGCNSGMRRSGSSGLTGALRFSRYCKQVS